MRVEPHTINSYMHVLKRGARGMPITNDEKDKLRFVRLLCHMNDRFKDEYWEKNTAGLDIFERPKQWPQKQPLVKILAWTLMPNHLHLLLKEKEEGGIPAFMQKLGNSMTTHYNLKYKEKGSIFQGSYKGKLVAEDSYIRWLAAYIMVKNVFELYPRGLNAAANDFEAAWNWAKKYPFSSFADYATNTDSHSVVDKDILGEIFSNPQKFKESAHDMILSRNWEKDPHLKTIIAE